MLATMFCWLFNCTKKATGNHLKIRNINNKDKK